MLDERPIANDEPFSHCPLFIPLFSPMKDAIEKVQDLPLDLPHPLPALTAQDIDCYKSYYPDGEVRLDFGINGIYVTTEMPVPEDRVDDVVLNTVTNLLGDFNNDIDTFNTRYPEYVDRYKNGPGINCSLQELMVIEAERGQLVLRTKNLAALRRVTLTRDLFEGLPTHASLFSIKTSGIGTRIFYLDQCVARVIRFTDYATIVPANAPSGERYTDLAPDNVLLAYYIDEVIQAQQRAIDANAKRVSYLALDPSVSHLLLPLLFAAEQANVNVW